MRFNPKSGNTWNEAGGMRRRLVLNIIAFAVFLYTFFFLLSILRLSFEYRHIPNEYREAANFDLTLTFLNGINPYALDTLRGNVPACVFQYGPLFSLLTAGIHFILPFIDIFTLHYLVAFACVLAAGLMAAVIAYEQAQTLMPSACVFLFTIACTWRYGYINAVPDTLGVTVLVLIFFIETRNSIKGKDFYEAALSVALLYIKQYFVIISLSLFIYKLISDKKAWVRFSISGLFLLAVSIFIINYTCPLYFTYTLLIVHGVSGQSVAASHPLFSFVSLPKAGLSGSFLAGVIPSAGEASGLPSTGWAFEILQLKSLISIFVFVFIGMIAGVIRAFASRTPRYISSRLFVIHSAVAFMALLFLGQNDGAWLSYYLQLLMPSVLIYSFVSVEKDVMDNGSKKYAKALYLILMFLMVMYTTYKMDSRLPYFEKSSEALSEWEKAYRYCDSYASEGEILYRAPLGINALSNRRYLYDNGHEMAIHQEFLDEYNSSLFYQKLFPYGGRLMEQHIRYREEMRQKVLRHEYSLVMSTATDGELVEQKDLEAGGYIKMDTLRLDMGWAYYDVDFWVLSDGDVPSLVTEGWT